MKRPRSACPGKDEDILLPPAGLLTITSTSFLSLTLTTILSASILSSSLTSATSDSVVDEINITVPISCSLTGTGMNTHNAEIPNGTYTADIGTTTLKAFCNDNEGFAIYAAGYTGNEIGGTNSNKLVGTSASNNATIETGTATSSGNPDISNWAMKLNTVSNPTPTYPIVIAGSTDDSEKEQGDPDFSTYTAVPNAYTKVAYRTSATDIGDNAEGATLTTTYAAYISKTQAADTYSGQVIYTLVHPSDRPAPGEFYTGADNINDITYLQEFAHVSSANRDAIIASMVPERQYTVKDSRDNKSYTIAKFQTGTDSNTNEPTYDVWMTQNLDLDIDSSKAYTNEDTDIGYNTTTGEYDTASWTPIRSTYAPTSTQTHEWCTGGTWNSQDGNCEDNNTPESYDPGNLYWNGVESDYHEDWEAYYNSCDYSTSTPVCDQSKNPISTYISFASSTPQYHLGNYYNWAAALATNDSSVYTTYDTFVGQSICPAGWTLPRVGTGEDTFHSLWNQYDFSESSINGNDKLWTSPLYFTAVGGFDGSLGAVGFGGYFRSLVAEGPTNAGTAFFLVTGDAYPSVDLNRSFGGSIRCILRPAFNSWDDGGPEEAL